jgi:hypothetical protein
MRFARVKRDDDALMLEISLYIFHSSNFLQHGSEFAYAFIAIFAFGRDLDGFQDGVIGAFREERIGWIRIVWSCRVHRFFNFSLTNVRHPRNGRLVHAVILKEVKVLALAGGSHELNCVIKDHR